MNRTRELRSVVIVGAGQAGFQTAASLRENGYDGRLVLIGEESGVPYERPPLSKAYLSGELDDEKLCLRPESYYARQSIELVDDRVVEIDRAARTVRLAGGGAHGYDHLVLATGAHPRKLPVPGGALRGVLGLRTSQDAAILRDALPKAAHVVVVGAGFIGLEFAAMASGLGRRVTVVEALDRPLARVATARTAAHFTWLHEQRGSTLVFGHGVSALHDDGDGRVASVELTDGSRLTADLVLVGTGVAPRGELAQAAGLRVAGGIVVDSRLLTGDPRISAIGDCASFPHVRTGVRVRVESVQNAVDHARCVADRLTGSDRTYGDLPWFWSDQFTSTLQIAGLGHEHDTEVVLGDSSDAFSVLLFRSGELTTVESVNRPADHMAARRLLAQRLPLDPREASRNGFVFKEYVKDCVREYVKEHVKDDRTKGRTGGPVAADR